MICPYCGNQTADNSTFCMHCGSSFAQPQYQTPVSNDAVNENYENAKYYIEIADAILSPAIKAFVLGNAPILLLIGNIIYPIVKRLFVKKWIKKLPDVDETLLDPVTYKEYKTARGKVTAAKRFSLIGSIPSVILLVLLCVVIPVLLCILAVELIVLGRIASINL